MAYKQYAGDRMGSPLNKTGSFFGNIAQGFKELGSKIKGSLKGDVSYKKK